MTVRMRMLQGGRPPQTQFSDNFTRTDLGSNWVRLLGGNDTVTLEGWSEGHITANQLVLQGRGENNPNANLFTGYAPLPVMYNLFNKPRTFAQATFISASGVSGGLCLRVNQSAEAGPITTPNGFDSYMCVINGRLDKQLNGGAQATIGANTVAIVANNVLRIEAVNVGTSTTITTYVNGAQVNQVTEAAAAFPIQRGYPCFIVTSVAGAPPSLSSFVWDSFSCGVF